MGRSIQGIHRWATTRIRKFYFPLRVFTEMDPEYRPQIQVLCDKPWRECVRVEIGSNIGIVAEVDRQQGGEAELRLLMLNLSGPGSGLALSRVLIPAFEASRGLLYAYVCWDEGPWRMEKRPDERIERLLVRDGEITTRIVHRTSGRHRRDCDLDEMVYQTIERLSALGEIREALNEIYLE